MNSKLVFVFLLMGLISLFVLSGCISDKKELKSDDSKIIEQEDSTSTASSTVSTSANVQEKMESCSFTIANMKFQYYVAKDKVYMKTFSTEDNIFTEQAFTKTETCAKSIEGGKGCYSSTEEDFQAVYDEALTGSCTEIDYNAFVFEIK